MSLSIFLSIYTLYIDNRHTSINVFMFLNNYPSTGLPTKNETVMTIWTLIYGFCTQIGLPPEFRVTVYVRKWSGNFFHFHYGKGSGKPEFRNDFFRKTEISGTLFRSYGSLRNSGNFRNIVPEIFRKFPVSGTFGTRITLKSYICKYITS